MVQQKHEGEYVGISQSCSTVHLRLKEFDDFRYQPVSEKGMAINPSCVIFHDKCDTEDKRKVAEKLNKRMEK